MTNRKKFDWVTPDTIKFLERGYLSEGEDVSQRIKSIAIRAENLSGIPNFADTFYENMGKGWYSLSSPVWANYGKQRGLPVSCFGSYVGDSIESILFGQTEVGEMSKMGGGTSGYFGDIRPRGSQVTDNGQAPGSVHFMNLYESVVDNISQGNTRRGRFSPYLPIEHPDIEEFLKIGTEGFPIQDLTHAVTVSDDFMEKMIEGDSAKRAIWAKVIQRRSEIGYPYIMFSDTMNSMAPDAYQDKDMKIYASNLCSEIALSSNENESFVCVLSSMNLLHFEEWKTTNAVEILTIFLDTVVTEFLEKLEEKRDSENIADRRAFYFMERAYTFAKNQRALGLGVLGWHSFLQSKMIPFDSKEASDLNVEVFQFIQTQSVKASVSMAKTLGEPELLKSYGRRNVTLNAIAPTVSSAFILGQVSQSIEPIWSNCYVKDLAKAKVTVKNPMLLELLKTKDLNTKEVWDSIKKYDGSVQHLDFLTIHEKNVFKTFAEISQMTIINQAGVRQNFIDQAQSLNLMVSPSMSVKDVNKLIISAWESGVKTLYYQHSINSAQEKARKKMQIDDLYCSSCEG